MTRPRAYQLNNPSTRFTKAPIGSAPAYGDAYTDVTGSAYDDLLAATGTGLVGGREKDGPAILTATTGDPYIIGIAPGNTFGITLPGVNAGSVITVTLQGGDFVTLNSTLQTTTDRVAARINTTLAGLGTPVTFPVASRAPGGLLVLTSADADGMTVGADAAVTISDGTVGIVNALGFGVVFTASASGTDRTRGIVTQSDDGLGGPAFPALANGQKLAALSDVFSHCGDLDFSRPDLNGQPVMARLSEIGGPGLRISWRVRGPSGLGIRSQNPDFDAIVAGNGVSVFFVNVADGGSYGFTAIFSGTPTSAQDVVDVINDAWRDAGSDYEATRGVAPGRGSEPFKPLSGQSFDFQLNGNATITPSFTGDERTAQDVVDVINAEIASAGQGAQGSAEVDGSGFVIKSSQLTGPSSTVEILGASFDTSNTRVFGISPGVYAGSFVAFVDGSDILIEPPGKGDIGFFFAIDGVSMARLGLSSLALYPDPVVPQNGESDTTFPQFVSSFYGIDTMSAGDFEILVPESMEAGDVQLDSFSENRLQDGSVRDFPIFGSQIPLLDSSGTIPQQDLPPSVDSLRAGKILIALPGTTDASPAIISLHDSGVFSGMWESVPSASNASGNHVRTLTEDDGTQSGYAVTVNATPSVVPNAWNKDTTDASTVHRFLRGSYEVFFAASGAGPFATLIPKFAVVGSSALSGCDAEVRVGTTTVVRNVLGHLAFADAGTAGTTAGAVRLGSTTSAYGDAFPRIGDVDSATSPSARAHTIFSAINARPTITCGDGTSTFGDFNGTTALEQACAFVAANFGTRSVSIYLKSGTYTASAAMTFTDVDVTIVGDGPKDTVVHAPAASGHTLTFSYTSTGIATIRGVDVRNGSGKYAVVVVRGALRADNAKLGDLQIKPAGASSSVSDSYLLSSDVFLSLEYGTEDQNTGKSGSGTATAAMPPVVFNNCIITCGSRCVQFVGRNGSTRFRRVAFNGCTINLASYAVAAGRLMTVNTGLVELQPASNARTDYGVGLVVEEMSFDDCTVCSLTNTGRACIIQLSSSETTNTSPETGDYGWIEKLSFVGTTFRATLPPNNLVNATPTFLVGHGAEELVVRDCDVFYVDNASNSNSYGGYPSWLSKTFNPYEPSGSYQAFGNFGAVCRRVTVDGLTVHKAPRKAKQNHGSSPADVADVSFAGVQLSVKNVAVEFFDDPAGGTPASEGGGVEPGFRIIFQTLEDSGSLVYMGAKCLPRVFIDNVDLRGYDAPGGAKWATVNHILLQTVNTSARKISVLGLTAGGVATANTVGIGIGTADTCDTETYDVVLDGCKVESVDTGISLEPPVGHFAVNVTINDASVNDITSYGVNVLASGYVEGVAINDLFMTNSGLTSTGVLGGATTDDLVDFRVSGAKILSGSFGVFAEAVTGHELRGVIIEGCEIFAGNGITVACLTGAVLSDVMIARNGVRATIQGISVVSASVLSDASYAFGDATVDSNHILVDTTNANARGIICTSLISGVNVGPGFVVTGNTVKTKSTSEIGIAIFPAGTTVDGYIPFVATGNRVMNDDGSIGKISTSKIATSARVALSAIIPVNNSPFVGIETSYVDPDFAYGTGQRTLGNLALLHTDGTD